MHSIQHVHSRGTQTAALTEELSTRSMRVFQGPDHGLLLQVQVAADPAPRLQVLGAAAAGPVLLGAEEGCSAVHMAAAGRWDLQAAGRDLNLHSMGHQHRQHKQVTTLITCKHLLHVIYNQ